MRKNLLFAVCFFAFLGVVNAQNEITMTVNTGSSVEFSLAERPIILSYAPTSVTPITSLALETTREQAW